MKVMQVVHDMQILHEFHVMQVYIQSHAGYGDFKDFPIIETNQVMQRTNGLQDIQIMQLMQLLQTI